MDLISPAEYDWKRKSSVGLVGLRLYHKRKKLAFRRWGPRMSQFSFSSCKR